MCARKREVTRDLQNRRKARRSLKTIHKQSTLPINMNPFLIYHFSPLSLLCMLPFLNFSLFKQMLCVCLSLVNGCIETIIFYLFFSSSLFALSSKSTAASVLLALTIWTMLINCFPKQTVPVTPRATHQYANFIISHTHKINSPTYRSKDQRSLIYTTRQKRVRYQRT